MYTINVTVQGTAPLMQHRYPMPNLADLAKGGHRQSGSVDYTQEWREYFYSLPSGEVCQPSSHVEGALIKAAAQFKIQGKRGKTYKDLFQAAVFVSPDMIPLGVKVPDTLDADADKPLYLDMRPVVINRARVVRIRPTFKAGWQLSFEITVIDDQIAPEMVHDILSLAGKTIGVGDFRPRFGRFMVTGFEVHR